jgi:hypothetical protein
MNIYTSPKYILILLHTLITQLALVNHFLLASNNAVAMPSHVEFMETLCTPLGAVSLANVIDCLWTLGT